MKKLLLLLASALFVLPESQACNTCGCGVGNYHYGILPQFQENFIGLRYRYRSYVSELEPDHMVPYSYESFQTTELWGRFYPTKRVQAFVFIPYNFNVREEGEKTTSLSGLGDIVVSANYNLINTYDSASSGLSHNLLVGAGLKLPTGQFRKIEDGLTVNQNFQLGTGSVDLLFNAIYTLRYRSVGVNTELTYSHNTTNRDEYKFGDAGRAGLNVFYIPRTGAITLMPNAGVGIETFRNNYQYGDPFPDTGGWAVLYNAGVEAYYRNIAVGATWSTPASQALFNGKVTANNRLALHATFMF